jgi:hypothetical protein
MKKRLPRKDFELHLLDLRMGALRKQLPNLSDHMRARMAKKFVKAKMRQLHGEIIEFTVPTAAGEQVAGVQGEALPAWLLAKFPARYIETTPEWLRRTKKSSEQVLKEAKKRWELCVEAEAEMRKAALDDLEFLSGEQWPQEACASASARDGRHWSSTGSTSSCCTSPTGSGRTASRAKSSPSIRLATRTPPMCWAG